MEDRLSGLLAQFSLKASTFYSGSLCGSHDFPCAGVGHLHLCRGGELQVSHADRVDTLQPPAVVFYPRAVDHSIYTDPVAEVEVICATVEFTGADFNPIALSLPEVVLHTGKSTPALSSTIEMLFFESSQSDCGQRAIIDRLCEILLIQLIRLLIEQGSVCFGALAGLAHPKLCHALVAMHETPAENWSLGRLAKTALMSRTTFSRTFHTVVGQTPLTYLNQWRMSLATQLLLNGGAIGRVALDLGFSSQSAFSRTFSQYLKKSPRAWLNEQRGSTGLV
ncbi:MAG: AraC family transcriptional regulator [Gammaproteobacteria bacterium]|nr:AraC family transcriptional regulator [Gammaproteobacteria bacterium]